MYELRRVLARQPVWSNELALATYEALYLGSFTSLDPVEGRSDTTSENANLLVGLTFGGSGSPLYDQIVNLTLNDANNNGIVTEDPNRSAEPISYDLGSGTVTSNLDSSQSYTVTITYGPNSGLSPVTVTLVVAQDDLGNMFIVPPVTNDATAAALAAGPIESIHIDSLVTATSSGLTFNRFGVDLLCFAGGTRIATAEGEVAVERLVAGMRIATLDGGLRPLRAVLSTRVPARGRHAPIVFRAGALGNQREIAVSPQHRMLMAGAAVELHFGCEEVLAPAIALVNGVDVVQREGGMVTYYHLIFDRHEIVCAEGIWSESLHFGPASLAALSAEALEQLEAMMPGGMAARRNEPAARPCLKVQEAAVLCRRPAPAVARRLAA